MSLSDDRHAWAEPALEPVADEVFRIPLPLPGDALRAVNVYAIRAGRQLTLVDSGWETAASWALLEAQLQRLGGGVASVRTVAVTHLHHDHIGQAARLRDAAGATVCLGVGERQGLERLRQDPDHGRGRLATRLRRLGAGPLADHLAAGDPVGEEPPHRARYAAPDLYLGDGSVVVAGGRALTVLATPGHTAGHVCLVDPADGLLFAGDHVLPQITPSIGLEPVERPGALGDFLASLERVRRLDVRTVLPAHGPVFVDLAGRVDALTAHHEQRLAACSAALVTLGPDPATPQAVAEALPWTRRARRLADLDGFNQMLAVGETAAHLELLVARHLACRAPAGGVDRYRPGAGPPARTPTPATEESR